MPSTAGHGGTIDIDADDTAPLPRLPSRALDLAAAIERETKTHPFRTLGVAAGAGFVLGGGLFTPLALRTLRAGLQLALRTAVVPALTQGLAAMGARLLEQSEEYGTTTYAEGERP
jgi:hypothetical protein